MNELVALILAAGFCEFSPIKGVVYFIDASDRDQVVVGQDDEDGRANETFASVEDALKGFVIDGKAIIDYKPTVKKAAPPDPVKIVD